MTDALPDFLKLDSENTGEQNLPQQNTPTESKVIGEVLELPEDHEALVQAILHQGNGQVTEDSVRGALMVLRDAGIKVPLPGEFAPVPMLETYQEYLDLPQKYQTYLRVLEKSGRKQRAAEVAGISASSIRALRQRNQKFDQLVEVALANRKELLEDEAIRRAIDGVKKGIYYKGIQCGTEQVYSDQLLSKLLDAHDPEKFSKHSKTEVDVKVGVATLVVPATESVEDWTAKHGGTIIDQEPEDPYG